LRRALDHLESSVAPLDPILGDDARNTGVSRMPSRIHTPTPTKGRKRN